jgi:aminocarboxymuconate-semialdehyde decarboxylase
MKSIDIHAHVVPRRVWEAAAARHEWYGYRHEPGEGLGTFLGNGKRTGFTSPKVRFTPEERLADMDAQGVDVQVLSIHTPFFGYHLDAAQGGALAREVNDEIAAMTRRWPTRFAGLATLPMQDTKAAIEELERAVSRLGLKGAELDTIVNGENWDAPRFLPFFKAAEAMGAVLFYHPQPQHNFMTERTTRYGLFNSLGVIMEDAIVVAILILGGVLEACPALKVCVAHGGRPATRWAGWTGAGRATPTRARASPGRRAATRHSSTTTPWWAARPRSAS